jgi:hypothetical protein
MKHCCKTIYYKTIYYKKIEDYVGNCVVFIVLGLIIN